MIDCYHKDLKFISRTCNQNLVFLITGMSGFAGDGDFLSNQLLIFNVNTVYSEFITRVLFSRRTLKDTCM